MNDHHTPAEPSLCTRLDDALQSFLDGEMAALPPEVESHRQSCPECRANFHAAGELLRGLRHISPPPMPPGFSERTVAAVLADVAALKRRRDPRRLLRLALAASVVLALGGIWLWSSGLLRSSRPDATGPVPVAYDPVPTPPLSIRDSLGEAGSAVASLTRRTTDETIEPTRKLLASRVEPPALASVNDLPKAIDPAAQSLEEVRQGAAAGFEPVASSARRALSMFMSEMPSVNSDRKNDF